MIAGTLLVDEVLSLRAPATPGSQQRAVSRRVVGGGQVWHTSLAAARAGATVRAAGRRGDDDDADRLRRHLAASGVDVVLRAVGSSRRAVVLDSPPHERAIVSVAGDGVQLPDTAPGTDLAAAGWLHLDGYGLDDDAGDLLLALATAAAAAGLPVSLEPPSISGLGWRRERIRRLPALALLVGRPDEVAACGELLAAAPRDVVTHDGPRPARWRGASGSAAHPSPAGTFGPTLGAGDRFAGGLLATVLAGAGPADALAAATRAAADAG